MTVITCDEPGERECADDPADDLLTRPGVVVLLLAGLGAAPGEDHAEHAGHDEVDGDHILRPAVLAVDGAWK